MTTMTHAWIPLTLALAAAAGPGHPGAISREPARDGVPPSDSGAGHRHRHGSRTGDGHKWIAYDAGSHTVTFKLVAGRRRAKSRLNFDGYSDGGVTLVLPPKTTVVMNFVNADSMPHSAAVIADGGPVPHTIPRPAIAGAATTNLVQGLPRHATQVVRFAAPASGVFRIVSGVPGEGRSGMWIGLRIDPTAKAPSWVKHS